MLTFRRPDRKTTATVTQQFVMAKFEDRDEPVIVIRFAVTEIQAPPSGEDVKFEMELTPEGKKAKTRKINDAFLVGRNPANPWEWVVMATVKDMAGKAVLYADWKDTAKHPWWTENSLDLSSPLNTQSTVRLDSAAPQLRPTLVGPLVGAEKARMKTFASLGADDATAIIAALKHVHDRLVAGLGELWAAAGHMTCKNDLAGTAQSKRIPLCECDPDQLSGAELKEAWAQAISEHIVGSLYDGAGNGLGSWINNSPGGPEHDRDSGFMVSVRDQWKSSGELCLSLCFACQQLSNWVVFTLGHSELADDPVSAGFAHPGLVTGATTHALSKVPSATDLKAGNGLAIGTCVYAKNYAHVGVLVRVFGDTSFQLLDSGGWNIGAPEGAGNHDTREVIQLTAESSGFMVPPAPADADLRTAIKALRNARPLGVAQLAIFKRGHDADGPLWVSPKIPMHETISGRQIGYPLSRILASLRGTPACDALTVRWFVWSPGHSVMDPKGRWKAEATNNLTYVIKNGRAPVNGLWWWQEKTSPTLFRPIERFPMVEYEVGADGVPIVVKRHTEGKPLNPFSAFLNQEFAGKVDLNKRRDEIPKFFGGNL